MNIKISEKSLFQKIKEAASHTLIYGLGSVLQTALGFILIPLYTRYYSTDMYGTLALITLCGTLAGAVFYLGASSALSRSYFDYEAGHERKKVISTSLYLSLLGACAQVLLGFMFKNKLSFLIFNTEDYAPHIFIILISSALTFLNNLFYILLRFERKSRQVVIINIISLIMSASLITSFLIVLKLGVMAPILGQCINQVLIFGILFYLTKESFVIAYSKPELKIQLQFGIPTIFVGLATYLLSAMDRFLMNSFCTLNDVGVYSLGYLLGTSINILFILPFGQIWAPMRMEYRNDNNARDLYKIMLTYYFIVGLFITIGVSIFSKEILLLLSGRPDYIIAYKVVPIVMMAYLIYGIVGIIDNGIYFSRKISYHAYIFWSCVVINWALNYTLIPIFGYMAAAYNILITFSVTIGMVFIVSNRLFKIQLEPVRLVKIFISSGIVLLMGLTLTKGQLINTILVKATLMVVLVVFWYAFVLDSIEKEKILNLLAWREC